MKELTEIPPPVSASRLRFEAGRSFDLDDDLEFCPGLLTEDDVSPEFPLCMSSKHDHIGNRTLLTNTFFLNSSSLFTPHPPTAPYHLDRPSPRPFSLKFSLRSRCNPHSPSHRPPTTTTIPSLAFRMAAMRSR